MARTASHRSRELPRLRDMEGHRVGLALADGSQLDDVTLVSAGRGAIASLWLEVRGMDVFILRTQVLDAWDITTRKAA